MTKKVAILCQKISILAPFNKKTIKLYYFLFQLTVHAKNNANILNKPYSEAVYRLDMYIQKSVKVYFNNRTYYYSDLCLGRHNQGCPGNKHISIISDLFQHGLNITYPTIHFGNV